MHYHIRHALENVTVYSYLKDEGTSLEKDIIDCSLGVNPCGVTPTLTKEAYADTFDLLHSYPAHPFTETRRHICQYFSDIADLDISQISMQSGSMSALCRINSIFLEEGTTVVAPMPCFSSYTSNARSCGAAIVSVPLKEEEKFAFDTDRYIAALKPGQRLAYIDNPNNPTGQALPLADIRRILDAAREKEIVVVIDEAYGDFLEKEESAVSLINDYDNLVIARTFSKGFGLGALRAGYIVLPKAMVPVLAKDPGEMTITTPADKLIPIVLQDPGFLKISRETIANNKKALIDSLHVLHVSKTRPDVPIGLYYTDADTDLGAIFWKHGIRVEYGVDFEGIGKRHVRLRVPDDVKPLLTRIAAIESELQA